MVSIHLQGAQQGRWVLLEPTIHQREGPALVSPLSSVQARSSPWEARSQHESGKGLQKAAVGALGSYTHHFWGWGQGCLSIAATWNPDRDPEKCYGAIHKTAADLRGAEGLWDKGKSSSPAPNEVLCPGPWTETLFPLLPTIHVGGLTNKNTRLPGVWH